VGSLGTWNVADDFALIGIHDDVVRAAGDEQVMGGGIDFKIVPATGSAEFHFLDEMVAGAAGRLGSGRKLRSGEERAEKKRERSANANLFIRHRKPPGTSRGV